MKLVLFLTELNHLSVSPTVTKKVARFYNNSHDNGDVDDDNDPVHIQVTIAVCHMDSKVK